MNGDWQHVVFGGVISSFDDRTLVKVDGIETVYWLLCINDTILLTGTHNIIYTAPKGQYEIQQLYFMVVVYFHSCGGGQVLKRKRKYILDPYSWLRAKDLCLCRELIP